MGVKFPEPAPPYEYDPDPCPMPPAPPRGNESTEEYDKRCGPFIRMGNSLYQTRYIEWLIRRRQKEISATRGR